MTADQIYALLLVNVKSLKAVPVSAPVSYKLHKGFMASLSVGMEWLWIEVLDSDGLAQRNEVLKYIAQAMSINQHENIARVLNSPRGVHVRIYPFDVEPDQRMDI